MICPGKVILKNALTRVNETHQCICKQCSSKLIILTCEKKCIRRNNVNILNGTVDVKLATIIILFSKVRVFKNTIHTS